VAEFTPKGDTTIDLVEPAVVNGCQTTRTIWEVFHERLEAGGTGTDDDLEKWRKRANRGVVVAKIVKVGVAGESMLLDITKYTNSQNAVRDKDFIALDSDFRSWAAAMAERYDIYLEIQRGGWDSRRALQKQNPSMHQFGEASNAFDLMKVFGSGWLGEAGRAFGRNAAFVPGGTVFKRIMEADNGEAFGVEDLYAAFLLDRASHSYNFGRGAEKPTRRQTRYFFFMVAIELLKDVLARSEITTTNRHLTTAVQSLFDEGSEGAKSALLDNAVEVIDEYLSKGTEDSVFDEPCFATQFANDLNGLLKSDGFGRNDEQFPRFRALVAGTKRLMGKSQGGQHSAREVITKAIKRNGRLG